MTIAVVIPALDEASQIESCVASARTGGAEVIVVDGGSTDGTPELAERAGARVLRSPRGRSRQLESGWRASGSAAVVFLHADTRLPRGFAPAIRRALEAPDVVGGAFAFRFDHRTPVLRFIEWGARLRAALFALPYGDQAIFARRSTLEEMGGIPQVPLMEDLDLVRELKRRGRLALLAPAAVTSARRYEARGPLRAMLRHWVAAGAWALGVDRERVAAWYGR